jgi:hypothetical protein
MKNELNTAKMLNGGIRIDLSGIDAGKEEEYYEEIMDVVYSKSKDTGVRYFAGHMVSEGGSDKITRGAMDVIFEARDILGYKMLERELKKMGYPVEFSRILYFARADYF